MRRACTACIIFCLVVAAAGCDGNGEEGVSSAQTGTVVNNEKFTPALEHVTTHEMQEGTHRPEIIAEDDNVYLIVVEHDNRGGEDIRHRGYIFDTDFNQLAPSFMVSCGTPEYGKGADQRATVMGDEIVLVYQSLVLDESVSQPGTQRGPMEQYASSQSLILARFSADTGEELFRKPIVANATDFDDENIPDFCILPCGDSLLVSTGSGGGLKIREVDMEANILKTYEYMTSPAGIPSTIGNSLLRGVADQLMMFGSHHGPEGGNITVTAIDEGFNLEEAIEFPTGGREDTFPTGALYYNGYYFVGYGSRETWKGAIEDYPLYPYLKIIDAKNMEVVADMRISDQPGSGHCHPNLAIADGHLYFAWSRSVKDQNFYTPQVLIEEFTLQFAG